MVASSLAVTLTCLVRSSAKPKTKAGGAKGKPGAQKGHKGSRYQLLKPTKEVPVVPETCSCGHREFTGCRPYYTHQHLELPEVKLEVTHFTLHQGACASCGGVFDNYSIIQGSDQVVPVDVFIPGCPPRPEAVIYGIVQLQKKIAASKLDQTPKVRIA